MLGSLARQSRQGQAKLKPAEIIPATLNQMETQDVMLTTNTDNCSCQGQKPISENIQK